MGLAYHPSGEYLASTGWAGGTRLWDARTGQGLLSLPGFGIAPLFRPDGRRLLTAVDGSRLWEVGTCREGVRVGVAEGFSRDGRYVIEETGGGALRLLDPATGRSLARLDDPFQARATDPPEFTPDGGRMVLSGGLDSPTLRVWDLRAIRLRLDELGLGDGFPVAADPAAAVPGSPPIVRIEVDPAGR